jgi:hypothetical protein
MNQKFAGALSGLRELKLRDLQAYKNALGQTNRLCWQQYFPFMYCFSQNPTRKILIGEEDGSICVYLLMKEDGRYKLFLYFLPMPMSISALRLAVQRAKDFNSSNNAVIFWVDAENLGIFDNIPSNKIIPLDHEYLYSPCTFKSMEGSKFKNFRYNLSRIRARDDIEIRPYNIGDADACLRVISDWTDVQSSKYEYIRGHDYTSECLWIAPQFNPRDLFGLVVLVDGEIRSFGFGGEMRPGLGNIFITKSDHRIKGINYFLRHHLVLAMDECEWVNDSTANGAGVQYAKESCCPVSMHSMFRVHLS